MDHEAIALVTGGAAGICQEVALRLSQINKAVVVVDNDDSALEMLRQREITNLVTIRCDVANDDQVASLFAELESRDLLPTVLVNGVGGDARKISFAELDSCYLQASLEQNLFTAFRVCQHALPYMTEAGYGRIVNFASVAGRTYTLFSNAAYVCAKSAVIGLTKQLAYEVADRGITVNAVAHGPIATKRIQDAWALKSPQEQQSILDQIPLGRLGSTSEAASAVVHFCGSESGYATGTTQDINGGLFI